MINGRTGWPQRDGRLAGRRCAGRDVPIGLVFTKFFILHRRQRDRAVADVIGHCDAALLSEIGVPGCGSIGGHEADHVSVVAAPVGQQLRQASYIKQQNHYYNHSCSQPRLSAPCPRPACAYGQQQQERNSHQHVEAPGIRIAQACRDRENGRRQKAGCEGVTRLRRA